MFAFFSFPIYPKYLEFLTTSEQQVDIFIDPSMMSQGYLSWIIDILLVLSSLSVYMCNCDCFSLHEHYFAFISAGSWLSFLSPSHSFWFLWVSLSLVLILYSKYAVVTSLFPIFHVIYLLVVWEELCTAQIPEELSGKSLLQNIYISLYVWFSIFLSFSLKTLCDKSETATHPLAMII